MVSFRDEVEEEKVFSLFFISFFSFKKYLKIKEERILFFLSKNAQIKQK